MLKKKKTPIRVFSSRKRNIKITIVKEALLAQFIEHSQIRKTTEEYNVILHSLARFSVNILSSKGKNAPKISLKKKKSTHYTFTSE